MSSAEPPAPQPADSLPVHPPAAAARSPIALGPLAGGAVGLAAGLIVWGAFLVFYPVFVLAEGDTPMGPSSPDASARAEVAEREADLRNGMLFLAGLGGLLCAALAAAEGRARRSWRTIVCGGLGGVVVGVALGCLGPVLGAIADARRASLPADTVLGKSILVQVVIMATLGLGPGLLLGILARRVGTGITCVVGGSLAGGLAGTLYVAATAYFAPGAATELLIPWQPSGQFFWTVLPATVLGVIVAGLAQQRPPRAKPAANAARSA